MSKPSFILCSLLLVVLIGWLGIAQPAEAQQTVTLSGRVTDAAGQPVSGAAVELFRMPDWTWIDGQDTDGNGAYSLSAPPGTYLFRVLPHGPFLLHLVAELPLSTDTTRTIVLETGVTLSGQVTANGQLVPWAYVSVVNDEGQEVGFGGTHESGRYSLGVPVGTYQVNVYSDEFLNPMLEGVAVPHDTVLNITLESGVMLEGKVVDDGGHSVSDAQVCARLPAEEPWEGICSETGPGGGFQLRVPPAEYVITATPLAPLHPTRRRLEVNQAGVANLVLTVSRQPTPFVPDDPPKAALISISSPTADGEVTLTGAAGSVTPGSAVVVITPGHRAFYHDAGHRQWEL